MKRRGQAALEFLTTYGWMLLLVVVVIGVMTYYGLGDTKSAVPSTCYLGHNFDCKSFVVDVEGNIGLEVECLEKQDIILTQSSVVYPGESSIFVIDYVDEDISVGETFILFYDVSSDGLSFSGKDKFEIKLYYTYDEIDALPKVASGEVIAEIIDDSVLMDEYEFEFDAGFDIDDTNWI